MSFPLHEPVSRRLAALALLALCHAAPPQAADGLILGLGRLEGAGWSARGVRLELDFDGADATARYGLRIEQLSLDALEMPLTELRLECASGHLDGRDLSCREGRLEARHPLLE
ncbi:MAG: hypothetical protein G8D58_10795, partial [gamma proteobacterium symbiont of Phacoides pectinatus]